ncbi:MAG TPA: bifunctional hydroxymethylpyrimidine kinase/phosphomethylpyrimidine kinase [Candidatus Gemmiger faecigallinarum]|nr:bifunctional hydroxymethylpyrimidine kinase/phosphomethylpyrimidine kinase [Candidatus Gemmiger faecigallinarum]
MNSAPKTVLCIHDLPGFGRAALSVIVPVLSALGVQPVALPTAVLSTHTGGLGTPARLSNPGYGPAALAHYQRLGLRFDCIYSGYLADANQAKLVEQALDLWPGALAVVDPVLGDHGRMYAGLSEDMVPAMRSLCARAGLILPNATEAALLLGDAPAASVTLEAACQQAARLTQLCPQVVVTGVPAGRSIACVGASREGGSFVARTPFIPRLYHGTGDIFGAVVCGRLMQGNVTEAAVQAAAAFVADCIRATPEGADERLGVWLEAALPGLMGR